MARETSGGRIGRTVYLPPEVWAHLEELARGESHPAFRSWEIRSGSVSSVIEKIVQWDAAKQLRDLQARLDQAEAKLAVARDLKTKANSAVANLRQEADRVAELIKGQARMVAAAYRVLGDTDL